VENKKFTFILIVVSFMLLFSGVYIVASSEEPIKIGFSSPLSPPGDYESGMINLRTANLAIEELNSKGGVLGREVNLVIGDDEGKPAVGVSIAKKLITEDKVSAIVGIWHGSVAVAQAKVANDYKVPIMAHYSWPDEFTSNHWEYVFRVSPFNSQIAELIIPFIEKKGYKYIVVMAEDSDYGIGFADSFVKLASDQGIKATKDVFPSDAIDFTPQLLKIKSKEPKPDLIIVSTVYRAGYLIPKQAYEQGLTPETEIMAGWDYPGWSPSWWPTVGEAGVGIMYPTFYCSRLEMLEKGKHFQQMYEEKFSQEPPIYAYFLYDEIMILADAMERAGSSDPQKIADALKSTKYEGTTGIITFERREGPGPVWNQWMGHQLFIIQYTKEGQSQTEANIVYP